MKYQQSASDREFRRAFEACEVAPGAFDHAAHVRLAYAYLCEGSVQEAAGKMKQSLLGFLAHLGVNESKYHETSTRAWVMAVDHFMTQSQACDSSADFMSRNLACAGPDCRAAA